jgi:predicted signal transduction protein with EAL and GGDEF domain
VTASIGVVASPPHGADPVELMQAANVALRLAKEQGPGRWRLLTPDEDTDRRLLRSAAVMPGALETGQLSVGYRMRVGLADERPVGFDAYPRWRETGLDGEECLALAEQTGLSPRIGTWLLSTALTTWRNELPLSVRLSPNQSAAPDLVDTVLGTLADTSLRANRLQLAMPATEVFAGRPQAVDNLTTLAEAGVRTAVHDFEGSPGDVVRLADLPLRMVSLTPRLVTLARTAGPLMTRALTGVTALVHEAGATVSVDDVRTAHEAAWWRGAGADSATGPLFPIQGEP